MGSTLRVHPGPTDMVRRGGRDPHRILLVGGGALAGIGLARHDLGLPGQLADLLVRRTQRGVQMHVLVDEDITSGDSIGRLRSMRIRRFDAVVVFLGAGPAEQGITEHAWRVSVETLARALDVEVAPAAPIHVYDSSSVVTMLSQTLGAARITARAARLTDVNEEVFEYTRRIRFEALRAPLGLYGAAGGFSADAYQGWAELITAALQPALALLSDAHGAQTARSYRDRAQRLEEQTSAVGRLVDQGVLGDGSFAQEVRTLQHAFGVEGVALAMLDGDRLRSVATSSHELQVDGRPAVDLCSLALRHDHLTLVNDAAQERTTEAGTVRSADLAFWASQPIHSWDGFRIGALYLFDHERRGFVRSQLDLLEDVAGRVEQHLWSDSARRPATRSVEADRRIAS